MTRRLHEILGFGRKKDDPKKEVQQERGIPNPPKGLSNYPLHKMRDYTPKELDWEHDVEYRKYSRPHFPKAFKDRKEFDEHYAKAPLTHLSHEQFSQVGNSTHHSFWDKEGKSSKEKMVEKAHRTFGHRRDVHRIIKQIHDGDVAPPIVLKHSGGYHMMAGNTRLSTAAAMGHNLPVKLIDISHRH